MRNETSETIGNERTPTLLINGKSCLRSNLRGPVNGAENPSFRTLQIF